ncbi:MAG: NAD(P)/FAD-dependent oxidoreductase [Deltaproteobacteria bacterium]|nr:NAD(P)/FAD-dependent oxidoreductase [Deltaproteobacteria bacterium]
MSTPVYDLLIVGGGPAGLSAAVEARRLGVKTVAVIDREPQFGGIPRHCNHIGFGWKDLHRCLYGPNYAHRRMMMAKDAGVSLLSETTAIGWPAALTLKTTGPEGLRELSARAILLTTGCRERPRAARLIAGNRPAAGIYTTGSLQQSVYFYSKKPGSKAVVVGAEHVSFSAVHTLRLCGVTVVGMVTEHRSHQSYPLLKWLIPGCGLRCNAKIIEILGRQRVEAVRISIDGRTEDIACDTVVFTGDWIVDNELARLGKLSLDQGTLGPRTDWQMRTVHHGVFAAGNCLHGAETAGIAACEGLTAARSASAFLKGNAWPSDSPVYLEAQKPILWIFPNLLRPRNTVSSFTVRVSRFLEQGRFEIKQGGQLLGYTTCGGVVPNRSIHLVIRWDSMPESAAAPLAISYKETTL